MLQAMHGGGGGEQPANGGQSTFALPKPVPPELRCPVPSDLPQVLADKLARYSPGMWAPR